MMRIVHYQPQAALLAGVAVLLLCGACQSKPRLPADPGLALDIFGVGVSLGMDYAAAQAAAAEAESGVVFWIITREEASERAPYTERPPGKDLAIVLHDGVPGGEGGTVRELRFYLAEAEKSQVSLLGKQAAGLHPEDVIIWLGEPLNNSSGGDGRTHLTYYFTPVQKSEPGIKLVLSHEPDGRCFAFSVSIEQQLPH